MRADASPNLPTPPLDDDCGRPIECAKKRLPTVAAFLIALASSIVMTFAG